MNPSRPKKKIVRLAPARSNALFRTQPLAQEVVHNFEKRLCLGTPIFIDRGSIPGTDLYSGRFRPASCSPLSRNPDDRTTESVWSHTGRRYTVGCHTPRKRNTVRGTRTRRLASPARRPLCDRRNCRNFGIRT